MEVLGHDGLLLMKLLRVANFVLSQLQEFVFLLPLGTLHRIFDKEILAEIKLIGQKQPYISSKRGA